VESKLTKLHDNSQEIRVRISGKFAFFLARTKHIYETKQYAS